MQSDDLKQIIHNLNRLLTIFLVVIILEAGIISGVVIIAQTNYNNIADLSIIVYQLSKTIDTLDDNVVDIKNTNEIVLQNNNISKTNHEIMKNLNETVYEIKKILSIIS